MTSLSRPFHIDCFDAELSARMPHAEWQRILEMRNHPRFLHSLARYAELIPPYFSDNLMLNKVVTEVWRFEMLVYTLYLYDTRNPDDPRSGLTVGNLQKICEQQKCASRGRVFAIMGIMRLARYVRAMKNQPDKRVIQLEPSENFVSIVEGWNNRIFEIIDATYPEDTLAACHEQHPRFGWEMRKGGAEGLLSGWRLLDPFPEVNHFVSRDGGWMLLLTCVAQAIRQGDAREISPVSIDLAAFGPRFGVSRSHLRRVLESAYEAGLLFAPPRNGTLIALSPHLVAAFITCMASELAFYRGHSLAGKALLMPQGPERLNLAAQ